MTARCDLCELQPVTHVYHRDHRITVIDCSSCGVPMAVWREHTMDLTALQEAFMEARLHEAAQEVFGPGRYWIDKQQRKVSDHVHWHAREK